MGAGAGRPRTALAVDVGGVALKWALAAADGGGRREGDGEDGGGGADAGNPSVVASGTLLFALWRDPGALGGRLRDVRRRARRAAEGGEGGAGAGGVPPDVTALSVTADLADCFRDRSEGVRHVVAAAGHAWDRRRLRVLCRDGAWRSSRQVEDAPREAAAANWRAPAAWLARRGHDVLLADMGSTTTDLIPVRGGEVGTDARTDLDRLRAGQLVYTGLLRTPVCAMVREVELGGESVPVAAEPFAVAADVHLWLGSIGPEAYACDPPDGGPATRAAAGRRLARMVCSDPGELGDAGVDAVARAAADAQARDVVGAVRRQRSGAAPLPRAGLPTGAGADLMAALLRRAGLELAEPPPPLAGGHAPASTATTLALLALEDLA